MRQAIQAVGKTTTGPDNTNRDSVLNQLKLPPVFRVPVAAW